MFSKTEKIEIYESLRHSLLNEPFTGMCGILCGILREENVSREQVDVYSESHLEKYFPELWVYKPENSKSYWFPMGRVEERLEVVDKILNNLRKLNK